MWGPALGALAACGPPWRAAFRNLYRPSGFSGGRRRFAITWAVLLPPIVFLLSALLAVGTGAAGSNPQRPRFGLLLAGIAAGTVLSPLLNFPVSLGEELGWRGFLFPALGDRWGERRALALTGLVWGVWHAPLIVNGYNYPGHPWLAVPLMVGLTSLMNVVLVVLGRVGGSLTAPTLAHGAFNGMAGLSVLLLSGGDPALVPPSGVLTWIPLAVAAFFLLAYGRRHEPPD